MAQETEGLTPALRAFDYATQEWVEGARARDVLVVQTKDALEILRSPRGAEYLAFTHRRGDPPITVEQAVERLELTLLALQEAP